MSYAPEIYAGDRYVEPGSYRFATRGEAYAFAKSCTPGAHRATVSYDRVNYSYADGRLAYVVYEPPAYPYAYY
jgi:hypothetical protein